MKKTRKITLIYFENRFIYAWKPTARFLSFHIKKKNKKLFINQKTLWKLSLTALPALTLSTSYVKNHPTFNLCIWMEEIVQIILKKLPFLLSRLWKLSTKVTSLIGLSSCSYIRVSSCLFPSPFFVVLVLTIKTHTGRRKGRRRTKTTTTRTKAKKLYYYSSGFLKLLFWPWRTASEASMRAFAAVQYLVTVPFSLLLHIWTGRLRNSVLKSKNQTEIVRIVDIFRFDKFFLWQCHIAFSRIFSAL